MAVLKSGGIRLVPRFPLVGHLEAGAPIDPSNPMTTASSMQAMKCMRARMPRAQGCARAATYQVAVGPHQGQKAFTLQTVS